MRSGPAWSSRSEHSSLPPSSSLPSRRSVPPAWPGKRSGNVAGMAGEARCRPHLRPGALASGRASLPRFRTFRGIRPGMTRWPSGEAEWPPSPSRATTAGGASSWGAHAGRVLREASYGDVVRVGRLRRDRFQGEVSARRGIDRPPATCAGPFDDAALRPPASTREHPRAPAAPNSTRAGGRGWSASHDPATAHCVPGRRRRVPVGHPVRAV